MEVELWIAKTVSWGTRSIPEIRPKPRTFIVTGYAPSSPNVYVGVRPVRSMSFVKFPSPFESTVGSTSHVTEVIVASPVIWMFGWNWNDAPSVAAMSSPAEICARQSPTVNRAWAISTLSEIGKPTSASASTVYSPRGTYSPLWRRFPAESHTRHFWSHVHDIEAPGSRWNPPI